MRFFETLQSHAQMARIVIDEQDASDHADALVVQSHQCRERENRQQQYSHRAPKLAIGVAGDRDEKCRRRPFWRRLRLLISSPLRLNYRRDLNTSRFGIA